MQSLLCMAILLLECTVEEVIPVTLQNLSAVTVDNLSEGATERAGS